MEFLWLELTVGLIVMILISIQISVEVLRPVISDSNSQKVSNSSGGHQCNTCAILEEAALGFC